MLATADALEPAKSHVLPWRVLRSEPGKSEAGLMRGAGPAAALPHGAADALTLTLSNFAEILPSVRLPPKQLAMLVFVPIARSV